MNHLKPHELKSVHARPSRTGGSVARQSPQSQRGPGVILKSIAEAIADCLLANGLFASVSTSSPYELYEAPITIPVSVYVGTSLSDTDGEIVFYNNSGGLLIAYGYCMNNQGFKLYETCEVADPEEFEQFCQKVILYLSRCRPNISVNPI